MRRKPYILIILVVLVFAFFNAVVYADFPTPLSFSVGQQINTYPITIPAMNGFTVSVGTSMSGTIKFTSPTGNIQNVPVQYTQGTGISKQVTLSEIGGYSVEESYTVTASVSIPPMNESRSGTRTRTYTNTSPGVKTLKITKSTVSGISLSLSAPKIEFQSLNPTSIEPGQSVSVNLNVKAEIKPGDVVVNSLSINGTWDVTSLQITDGGGGSGGAPPTVTINPPISQSQPNGDVQISYALQDAENNPCLISVQYSKDGASWSGASIVGDIVNVSPGTKTLYWKSAQDQPSGQGTYQIRIKANDGTTDSSWSSSSVTINNDPNINNHPPQVLNPRIRSIDSTTNQEPVPYHDPVTGDKLKAGYSYSDPDGDLESGSELVWYKNGVALPKVVVLSEQNKILSQAVTRGDKWKFDITPSDGKTKGEFRTSSVVTIGNAPPKVRTLGIEPSSPTKNDVLKATYDYYDPENDPQGATEILWYKSAPQLTQFVLQSQYNNQISLPAGVTSRGEKWKFTVVPKDSLGASGQLVESSIVTIQNQLPVIQNVSTSGTTGDITVSFNLIDQDNDTCDLKVWYRIAGSEKRAATIKGTVTPKYIIADVKPANGLSFVWLSKEDEPSGKGVCVVGIMPNDGFEDGNEGFSQSFSLNNNTPPKVTDVNISPASPTTIDDLIANYKFEDSNNDPEKDSKIRWYRNKTEQEAYRDKKTVPNSATKRDEEWYFEIEPSDGKEFGAKAQSAAVKIKNSPPEALNVKLEPDKATSEDDLKAKYTYNDADGDLEAGTQIRWYLNGGLQPDYNDKNTVPGSVTEKDQTWYFTVKVSDGTEPGKMVESNHVKLGNVAPVIKNLIVPEDGYRDVPITFDLADPDNDKCSLIIEYRGGLVSNYKQATIKESLTGISPGSIALTWDSAKDQNVRESTKFQIRITPNDGSTSGTPVESTFIALDNNIPPIASNLRVSPPNPTTIDNLTAVYDYYDEDGGKDSGSDIRWYKNNGTATEFKGNPLSASVTAKGESWYFTVKPRDGAKYGKLETSASVTILNSLPLIKSISIIPTNPKSGGTLTARYDYRDVDDDRESGSEIEWFRNGESKLKKVVNTEEDKVLSLPIAKGEKWHVVVKPKDGTDFGQQMASESVIVENAPPIVENLVVAGNSGGIIITFDLKDIDGDLCSLSVEYQGGTAKTSWVKATIQEPITKVAPGNGLKLTWSSQADERGQKSDDYKIRIIPGDGTSTGDNVVSQKFTLNNNTLPSAANLSILPEFPTTSNDLQATYTFVDPDGDKEDKPEIKWYKNGSWELVHDNLKVLPSSATTKGDRWHYTIKVNDGKDYGKLEMSSDVIIVNEPPTAVDVKLSPEYPKLEQSLIASYRYRDADGDSEQGTKIEWYKNSIYLQDFDNYTTIPGLVPSKGEEWYFTVKPNDGFDFGLPVKSNNVFIGNLPPEASSLAISPVNPRTGDVLIASYIYIDPDNDPEKGTKITWYKNNVAQSKYDDLLRVPADATARRQVWYFTVVPKDGKQFGSLKQSGSVIIGNTSPKVSNLVISPAYPLKKDDLVASYEYFDADGDPEGRSEIRWYKNNIWLSQYDGMKSIPSKELSDREFWYFSVRPKDDADFGDAQTSNTVEVGSPVPRVNTLTITPVNPVTTDDIKANYVYIDPNNIPESGSKIIWYKNGVPQTEYNDLKVLPSNATAKGDQWNFSVKPSNGKISGEDQTSARITILNSPPKLTAVIPQPKEPTTDDNILADYIYGDADGDKIAKQEIRWFRNGVLQPEYDNLTELPASATKRNEEWYYTVKVSDGTTFSDLVSSAPIKIRNGMPKATAPVVVPANPKTNDDLTATYKYADTEDDPESGTEIIWFKNDVEQQDFHNLKVVPASATFKGDRWYFSVKPRDGIDFGDLVSSSVVSVENTRPSVVDITATSSQVFRGGTVTIIATGKDIDELDSGSELKGQIAYKIGDTPWVSLPAEYAESPAPQWRASFNPDAKALIGDYDFRTKFTDSSGAESDWLERGKFLTVKNSPPVINSVADDFHVQEDVVKEIDLSTYGSDFESGKNVVWSLDESSVNKDLFKISVLRDKFLEIEPMDNKNGKDDITLILTDTDGGRTEKSDVTIIIDPVNDPPTAPTSVKITPENPSTLDTLLCEASGSTDPDNDNIVYRYQWYKNGIIQPDLKAGDVHYSKTAKGETWRCEVTPSDGIIDGPLKSAEIRIGNVAPSIASIKITGNTKDIKFTFDLEDPDSDLCDLKLEYRLKGGTWKSATTPDSLKGVKPAKGLSLTWQSYTDEPKVVTSECKLRIVANDGTINSETKESEAFLLDNKPPEFTVTAVANPVYETYIDVNVITDEKIAETLPEVSAKLSDQETVKLEMKKVGDNTWTGMLKLQPGFNGIVQFIVKGTDLFGNLGELEMQREFHIPAPDQIPTKFVLMQNYPNPVIQGTSIPYELPESQIVSIKIFNVKGQLIRTMEEGYKAAGHYVSLDRATFWDGKDDNGLPVASGVYFYYLKAGKLEDLKKLVVRR